MSEHLHQAKGFLRTADKYDGEHKAAIEKAGEKYEQSMQSAGASLHAAIVDEARELGMDVPKDYARYAKWRMGSGKALKRYAEGLRKYDISPDTALRALLWHFDITAARAEHAARVATETKRLADTRAKALMARRKTVTSANKSGVGGGQSKAPRAPALDHTQQTVGRMLASDERRAADADISDAPVLSDAQTDALRTLVALSQWVLSNPKPGILKPIADALHSLLDAARMS